MTFELTIIEHSPGQLLETANAFVSMHNNTLEYGKDHKLDIATLCSYAYRNYPRNGMPGYLTNYASLRAARRLAYARKRFRSNADIMDFALRKPTVLYDKLMVYPNFEKKKVRLLSIGGDIDFAFTYDERLAIPEEKIDGAKLCFREDGTPYLQLFFQNTNWRKTNASKHKQEIKKWAYESSWGRITRV